MAIGELGFSLASPKTDPSLQLLEVSRVCLLGEDRPLGLALLRGGRGLSGRTVRAMLMR